MLIFLGYNEVMVVLVGEKITDEQIKLAGEDYFGEYIKIVVDIEMQGMTIGGEWHADGEKILLENKSKQANLWGGGLDMKSNQINYSAMTNIKPLVNSSHIIEDAKIKAIFTNLVKLKFNL